MTDHRGEPAWIDGVDVIVHETDIFAARFRDATIAELGEIERLAMRNDSDPGIPRQEIEQVSGLLLFTVIVEHNDLEIPVGRPLPQALDAGLQLGSRILWRNDDAHRQQL